MTAYDWLMALGAIVVIAFVIKAFWRANKIDTNEQPDNFPPSAPGDGHTQ